ncbi:MAG: thermonuclease family protein [Desulfobacterales bacterium]
MRQTQQPHRKWIALGSFLLLAILAGGADAGEWAAVRRIADGDTIELADGRLVRYLGIDAPEIHHEAGTAQPFGFEARARNREWVGPRKVRLEVDTERFDVYGRTLAYVFLADGTLVNEALLQEGLAVCLAKVPNVRYEDRLLRAQRRAMESRRGIWRDWREAPGRYIGNRNSRRFHRRDCPEAGRILPKNRVAFATRWEAHWAGYSPSRECQPDFSIPSEPTPWPWPPPR